MGFFRYLFTPNHSFYDGVRPLNIYLLRGLYFLMAVFVATDAWSGLINNAAPWDKFRAVSLCVWAAYASLSIFGLINPLRWLPIVVFMVFYKTLWVAVVAYPLWRSGQLSGSPYEELASIFVWAPLVAFFIPWKYFFQNYVLIKRSRKNAI